MRLIDILNGSVASDAHEVVGIRQFLAYARVSTDDQERAGLSIPAQIREMQQYARSKGIVIAEVYQEAESAFSDERRRPEFWRMVERAKRDPQISGILVHDFSRFFRDPYAGPMVKGELLAHGDQGRAGGCRLGECRSAPPEGRKGGTPGAAGAARAPAGADAS